MTFKSRLTTAIATGAVLVNALAPMAFASTITVSGNGEQSSNLVNVSTNNTVQVNQTNNATISNHVDSSSSTGGNSSNGNTGGNTSITTGSATSTANVTNAANLNKADLSNCGCNTGAADVNVSGNGENSTNLVGVSNTHTVFLNQANNAAFTNDVKAKASTGGNDATSNTGGNVTIHTGAATTNVTVGNAANANVASLGGGNGLPGGSSVTISGNGEASSNLVGLDQFSAVVLSQSNNAEFTNDVKAEAKSGFNTANGNTNGNVTLSTGAATTNASVDNAANFNAADLGCNCVLEGLGVDVSSNGESSLNQVSADTNNVLAPEQANNQGFFNELFGGSKTGANTAVSNTGGNGTDPGVSTGDGTSNSNVNNTGNVNTLGNLGNVTLGTTFDFSGLWLFIHGLLA